MTQRKIDYFSETQLEKETNIDDENASNDSKDSNNKYDHKFHEKLSRKEMVKIVKLEDKTSTKLDPENYFLEKEANKVRPVDKNTSNNLNKIIIKVLEYKTYFVNLISQIEKETFLIMSLIISSVII